MIAFSVDQCVGLIISKGDYLRSTFLPAIQTETGNGERHELETCYTLFYLCHGMTSHVFLAWCLPLKDHTNQ